MAFEQNILEYYLSIFKRPSTIIALFICLTAWVAFTNYRMKRDTGTGLFEGVWEEISNLFER